MLWIAKLNKISWRIPSQPGIGKEGKNRKGRDEREDEKKLAHFPIPPSPPHPASPAAARPVVATCLAQKAIFLLLPFLHDFPYFPNRRRIKLKMPPRLSSLLSRKIQIKWGRTCCAYCGNRKIPFSGHQLEIERTPETSALLIQTQTTVFHDVQEKDNLKEIPGWQHLQNQGILFYSQAEAV